MKPDEIYMLTGEENKGTESLWREVFAEDSELFTNYYFKNKVEQNVVFAATDSVRDMISMVHLTPYNTELGGRDQILHYIVGVATKKEHRHKGFMNRLLISSLNYLREQGEPLAFLMPADPAIYEPYEFTYVYDRPDYIRNDAVLKKSMLQYLLQGGDASHILSRNGIDLEISILKKHDTEELVRVSNQYLEDHYRWFVRRDLNYYECLEKELKSQHGAIFLIKREGAIIGWFLYAEEEKEFIQEAIWDRALIDDSLFLLEKTRPIIMVRILDLTKLGAFISCEEGLYYDIQVKDPRFPDNNGIFRVETGNIFPITESELGSGNKVKVVNMTIQELTSELFGYVKIRKLPGIRSWNPVCINEIV